MLSYPCALYSCVPLMILLFLQYCINCCRYVAAKDVLYDDYQSATERRGNDCRLTGNTIPAFILNVNHGSIDSIRLTPGV
jgi:hypothetical protein